MAKKFDEKELEGISPADCPILCDVDRCVISQENVCVHPRKGGLQSKHQHDPECLRRFSAAKRALAQQELDKRPD